MLEPSWVGRRVTVRRAVGRDAAGRPQFADVVGDLLALDDERALVETRAGIVEVPCRLVAVAKLAPPSTRDELDLDAVAAQNLHPADTYDLGGWVLRANSGFTRRANSALPLRQPGMPLPEALGRAHGWYAQRGLPLLIQVPVGARRLLDAALAELGWAAEARTHLLTGRLDMVRASPSTAPPAVLAERPDDDWLGLYRGGGARPDVGRELLARHERVRFASIRVNGQVVAVGRGTVNEGWLGIMAVEVSPDARRTGLATAVMATLWDWGRAHGATRSYLQVTADNASALALYDKLGYWVHHDYHYRREP